MTASELIGVLALIIVALALPAMGESIRRRVEDHAEPERDAEFLAKLDRDPDQ